MDSQIYNIYIEYGMHVFYVTKLFLFKNWSSLTGKGVRQFSR